MTKESNNLSDLKMLLLLFTTKNYVTCVILICNIT